MEQNFEIKELQNDQFQVFYRVGESFCKRLGYGFDRREQASACVLFLETWLCNGGQICVTGAADEPGEITGFDGSSLRDPSFTSVELIWGIMTEGLCPMQLAVHLLGIDEAALAPYRVQTDTPCEMVDLARMLRALALKRQLASMKGALDELQQQQQIDNLGQRIMLHHRSAMLTQVIETAVTDPEQKAMFLQYLHGYPLNVIGEQYKVSYLVARKQVAEARKQFESYLMEMLTAKEQLKVLTAELLSLKEEQKAMRSCFVVREVDRVMPEKLDASFFEWATYTLKELFVSLDHYPFSVRATKSLETLGVKRVDQLLALNFQQLRSLPNIGNKTCSELEEFIRDNRLDALQHPAVLHALKVLAEQGLDAACKELGICRSAHSEDGFFLYDAFDAERRQQEIMEHLYNHPSLLRNQSYMMGNSIMKVD